MKIIFCKWGSICEKGIANAMQRLGITVITMDRKFESVDYDKGYLETLADLIQKNPDASCVFSVNFQRGGCRDGLASFTRPRFVTQPEFAFADI